MQPDGDGFWFSGADSSPQIVYHWDPITGWHAVTSLPPGMDIARVVGPCAGWTGISASSRAATEDGDLTSEFS